MSENEFARPVALADLGEEERAVRFTADEAERAALARRFGLASLERFEGEARLRRAGDAVEMTGDFAADLHYVCALSGEPFAARIADRFALRYEPASTDCPSAGQEIALEAGDLDIVRLEGETVDPGEAAAQSLSLALDPYPRAPDAEAAAAAEIKSESEAGPFAKLAALKKENRS